MRKLVTVLILLSAILIAHGGRSQEHKEYSVLAVEYIGAQDKPIAPIVISDSRAGAEWYRDAVLKGNEYRLISVHVVRVSLMAELIADAEVYRGAAQEGLENKSKSPQAVSVTLVTPQGRSTFLLNRKSGFSLLEDLKGRCKDDKSLQSDLSHFQNRISFPHMSKSQLKTQLSKTMAKVRTGSTSAIRDEAAEHLAGLTGGIDPNQVDDKTVADLVSLLDQPVGRYWVARCLGNLGTRAEIAIPKLQRLLPKEDCLRVGKSAAGGIRLALTQMRVTPPPPPNCEAKK